MSSVNPQPASRYRRRILGLGAFATGALYVIGAPVFNGRIESDLESRVPADLASAGFVGVAASFSGQDGTLTCTAPLDDPEAARAAAYDVRGVRAVELDRSCRVNTGAGPTEEESVGTVVERSDDDSGSDDSSGSSGSPDSSDGSSGTSGDEPASAVTDPAAEGTSDREGSAEDDLATVHEVVSANPDLAFLSVLLADEDIGRSDVPVTLFAATNAAFDAVSPDVLNQIQNDPDVLSRVLGHHVVAGALRRSDLADGPLMASDGSSLTVQVGDEITIDDATVIEADIVASNGVIHVIDTVLVPAELAPGAASATAAVGVTYDGERMTLTGVVASEVERQQLVDAAVESTGLEPDDEAMTVDPDTGLAGESAARLAELVRAMPPNLQSAEAGFDGTELYATGVARSASGRDAFVVAAAAADVSASVADTPVATDAEAADLEAQLNAFVAENPILFQPSSAVLVDSAFPVIDRVAADASRFAGIAITIEGHTDSDGIAIENLQLSQDRAEAVRSALIERGLAAGALEAVGVGSEQPVIVDGVEDKTASRRVEFRVATTT